MKKRILSLILACVTLLTAIPVVSLSVFAAAEDTFVPVTRFVLVSDIHVARHAANPGANVDLMMNRVYNYLTEKNDGLGVAAVISMGDSLNNGHEAEGTALAGRFNGIKAAYLEKYGTELPIYALMGNHEYNNGYFYSTSPNSEAFIRVPREEGMSDSDFLAQNNAAFAEAFIDLLWGTEASATDPAKGNVGSIDNSTTNWHYEIGGMHFIGVSLSNHWGNLSNETLAWLDAELSAATKDTPNAPVFLFSHHPLRNTVYATATGVSNWWSHYMPDNTQYNVATANNTHTQFTNIISKYPNVIFSTGHTHASGNAPLSIWQGETDGVGSGFTAYCPGGLVQTSTTVGGDFAVIEIDANNTVRIYPQNVNGAYTNPDGSTLYFEISYNGNGTHTYGYNETARKAETAEFSADQTATFANMWASEGKVTGTLSFGQALSGDVFAYTYQVDFVPQDGGATVSTTVESGAYARTLNIPATLYATEFVLQENKVYDAKITPLNYWGGKGETRVMLTDLKTPVSELKETDSYYSSYYTHPTSGTGINDYAVDGTTVLFTSAWSIGAYRFDDKSVFPYGKADGSYTFSSLSNSLSWQFGGVYRSSQSKRIIVGHNKNSTHMASYVTYTAEKSGTLTFTVENVQYYNTTKYHPYAIVKNYSTVLTANNAPFVNWDVTAGADNSTWIVPTSRSITNLTVSNIEVKQGDTISFVFSRGSVDNGDGICDVKMHVDYVKEQETVNYIYENSFVQNDKTHSSYPTVDKNTVLVSGTYPTYALVQNPNWELGCYYFGATTSAVKNGRNPYNAYTSQYGLIERPGYSMWQYGGGYYGSNFTIPSMDNYITYVAYVAEKDGILDVEITDLKFKYANTAYAIVKNFSEILTGTSGATLANWTASTRDRWEYAEAANTTTRLGVTNISVKKGDTIAIVFDRAELGNGDGFYDLNMTVKYRKEYVGESVSYEHKTGGENFLVTGRVNNNSYAILAEGKLAYEIGSYDLATGKAYPYGTGNDTYGVVYSKELGSYWSYGAMYSDGKMILPKTGSYIAYVAYTAEYDGKVDISVSNLTFQREGTAFTVVKNFKDVLVADGGTLVDYSAETEGQWYHCATTSQTYSFVIRDVNVKAGDTVAIVFDVGHALDAGYNVNSSENNRGPKSMNMDVLYSERNTTVYASGASDGMAVIEKKTDATVDWTGSAWTPILYKSRNDAGAFAKALIMDTYYPDCCAYIPSSISAADAQKYAMVETGQHPEWGATGAIVINGSSAAGYRYTAEKSGNVRFSFEKVGSQSGNATAAEIVMGYAIYVNGVKVWPSGENNWYNMRQDSRTVDYTDLLNAAMPTSLFVAEGDCVEILARVETSIQYAWYCRGNIFLPQVSYENESTLAASINNKFALTMNPQAELAEIPTATMNGKELTVLPDGNGGYTVFGIAAREMGDVVTWTYTYANSSNADGTSADVQHTTQTWTGSYAELMKAYIDHYAGDESEEAVAITNLAIATLNYGAAAQLYFGYKTDELVNESLTDEQKAMVPTGTYTNVFGIEKFENATFKPHSATLLLGDSVSLKLVVSGAADLDVSGYKMRFTCEGEEFLVDIVPCEGGGGQYKGILHGLTPTQWDKPYEITVVDTDGNAVSGTVTYSVSTYALRTADNAQTKAVTDMMLALYEMSESYRKALS